MTGEELRRKREEWNLTIEQLAERLEVTPDQIEQWERDEYACHPFVKIFDWAMEAVEYELLAERTPEHAPSLQPSLSAETRALIAEAQEAISGSEKTRARVKANSEDTRRRFPEVFQKV